jgi:hypothetical protein
MRTPSAKPAPITRLVSPRSAFVEGLRELVRQDGMRELLVKELGPLMLERRRGDGLAYGWRRAFFALLAVALASALAFMALGFQRSAQSPSAGGLAPANTTVVAEGLIGVRSRQIGLVALSTCGAIVGVCLTRWSPAARIQVQQLLSRSAAHAALSAGVKGLAQQSPPLAGRAIGPVGQLLRLVRAFLPSTAFEWLLVLFNLTLVAGVGSAWTFARSPAFKTVRERASRRAERSPIYRASGDRISSVGGRLISAYDPLARGVPLVLPARPLAPAAPQVVDSIQVVVSRTEFLRRLGAIGDASKLKFEKLALQFGDRNVRMPAMRVGPHQMAAGVQSGPQFRAARRWWAQLGIVRTRRPTVMATSVPRSI